MPYAGFVTSAFSTFFRHIEMEILRRSGAAQAHWPVATYFGVKFSRSFIENINENNFIENNE